MNRVASAADRDMVCCGAPGGVDVREFVDEDRPGGAVTLIYGEQTGFVGLMAWALLGIPGFGGGR